MCYTVYRWKILSGWRYDVHEVCIRILLWWQWQFSMHVMLSWLLCSCCSTDSVHSLPCWIVLPNDWC
jgi:hypothetical protein